MKTKQVEVLSFEKTQALSPVLNGDGCIATPRRCYGIASSARPALTAQSSPGVPTQFRRAALASAVAAVFLLAFIPTAMAGGMFGSFELAPGFLPDPAEGAGLAGGSVDANPLGPECAGNIDTSADHHVRLADDFDYLRFRVYSDEDTTLVIRGPNGEYYCNEDYDDQDPQVAGRFEAGNYEVFVGSYGGDNPPYRIEISEFSTSTPVGPANVENGTGTSRGMFESFELVPGFWPDPTEGSGLAGGSVDANPLGSECAGNIDDIADHHVRLADDFDYLRFRVYSDEDTTLVIRGPKGEYYCNEDYDGQDPQVDGRFEAGDYEVFVGTYGDEYPEYRIEISEIPD